MPRTPLLRTAERHDPRWDDVSGCSVIWYPGTARNPDFEPGDLVIIEPADAPAGTIVLLTGRAIDRGAGAVAVRSGRPPLVDTVIYWSSSPRYSVGDVLPA